MFLKGHERLENILDIFSAATMTRYLYGNGLKSYKRQITSVELKETDKIEYRNMKDNPRLLEVHFTPSLYAVLKTSTIHLKQHKQEILQKTKDRSLTFILLFIKKNAVLKTRE